MTRSRGDDARHCTRRALLGWAAASAALTTQRRVAAAPDRIVIRGANVLRPNDAPLVDAELVIEGEDIARIGTRQGPVDAAGVINATGKTMSAGLTDLLTTTGLVEVELEGESRDDAEGTDDPVRAAFFAADGYDPASTVVPISRTGGLTSVGIVPHGGLVSGRSAWVDLAGATRREALVKRALALHVSIDAHDMSDQRSVGTAFLRLRELFDDAALLRKNARAFDARRLRELSASRLDLEAVGDALAGSLPVAFRVDRASDIEGVLALASQYRLRALVTSGAEAWKVASQLAERSVPVITNPLMNLPGTFASRWARADNAALLHRAGVRVALTSGETHNARTLRQVAGNAVRAGMPARAALAAVTSAPAEIAGVADRYGELAKGRRANFVVWSGDPFELSTKVERVFIRGREVSLRTRQSALLERYRPR